MQHSKRENHESKYKLNKKAEGSIICHQDYLIERIMRKIDRTDINVKRKFVYDSTR